MARSVRYVVLGDTGCERIAGVKGLARQQTFAAEPVSRWDQ